MVAGGIFRAIVRMVKFKDQRRVKETPRDERRVPHHDVAPSEVQVSADGSQGTQTPPVLPPYVPAGHSIAQVPSGRKRYCSPLLVLPQEVAQPFPEQMQVLTFASHFSPVLAAAKLEK